MEINELKKRIPNLELILQNTCKTSIVNFIELKHVDINDKKILVWGCYSKELKTVNAVTFYRHSQIGIVIFDRKNDTIFINKNCENSYQLFKSSLLNGKKP